MQPKEKCEPSLEFSISTTIASGYQPPRDPCIEAKHTHSLQNSSPLDYSTRSKHPHDSVLARGPPSKGVRAIREIWMHIAIPRTIDHHESDPRG